MKLSGCDHGLLVEGAGKRCVKVSSRFPFFFGGGAWHAEFTDQGSNPHHICDNTRSLTCRDTRELLEYDSSLVFSYYTFVSPLPHTLRGCRHNKTQSPQSLGNTPSAYTASITTIPLTSEEEASAFLLCKVNPSICALDSVIFWFLKEHT